jgi:hypothetical protein
MLSLLFGQPARFYEETRPPGDRSQVNNLPHKSLTAESQFTRACRHFSPLLHTAIVTLVVPLGLRLASQAGAWAVSSLVTRILAESALGHAVATQDVACRWRSAASWARPGNCSCSPPPGRRFDAPQEMTHVLDPFPACIVHASPQR